MKLKNKVISISLTLFMFFSSFNYSSASVISTSVISYELLMGLMGIGVTFGLALPKDDDEYWEYTRNLKKHLQVVDDDYLDKLDKSIKEWKTNNNNKPDNEKEPLKVPYVDGLGKLFENVGNDSSSSYEYVSSALNPIPYGSTSSNIKTYTLNPGDVIEFSYLSRNGNHTYVKCSYSNSSNRISVSATNGDNESGYMTSTLTGSVPVGIGANSDRNGFVYLKINNTYRDIYFSSPSNLGGEEACYAVGTPYTKPSIPYSPTQPSVDNDELILPSLPAINIPNKESIPNYYEGLESPFEVEDPLDVPGDNPEDSPEDNPGDSPEDNPGNNQEGLINLIVPSSSYWNNKFDELFNNVGDNFPMLDIGRFRTLCVEGVPPKDIEVTIMGAKGTIFNTKYLNGIIDWLQPIVSAFMAFLLMLYNYRKVYKLIRGFEPFSGVADGQSVGELRGKTDGSMPEMGNSSFVGPSTAGTWSDGQSVTRGSIQSRYYGRDL